MRPGGRRYEARMESTRCQEAREYYNVSHEMNPQNKLPSIHIGGRRLEKENAIRSVVFDVKISNDGKYVFYKA